MAGFVGRDLAANPGEILLPLASGHLGDISMRNPGCALLERSIDESGIIVIRVTGIEAVFDEVMDGHFDCPYVDPSREPEISIEQVAVPVLLGRPPPQPARPGCVRRAGRIPGCVLERDRIVRQCFFSDHVADEDDEKLVGHSQCGIAEPLELFFPVLGGQIREIIGRLPRVVHWRKQREVFPYESLQVLDEFPVDTLLHRHRDVPDRGPAAELRPYSYTYLKLRPAICRKSTAPRGRECSKELSQINCHAMLEVNMLELH